MVFNLSHRFLAKWNACKCLIERLGFEMKRYSCNNRRILEETEWRETDRSNVSVFSDPMSTRVADMFTRTLNRNQTHKTCEQICSDMQRVSKNVRLHKCSVYQVIKNGTQENCSRSVENKDIYLKIAVRIVEWCQIIVSSFHWKAFTQTDRIAIFLKNLFSGQLQSF